MYRICDKPSMKSRKICFRTPYSDHLREKPRRARKPFDGVSITDAHQLKAVQLSSGTRKGFALSRKSGDPGGGSVRCSGHAADVSVSEIPRRPNIGAARGRDQGGEDVKFASPGGRRGEVERGIKLETTDLALRVEGEEGDDVGLASVFQDLALDLALDLVVANGASGDVVLRGDTRSEAGFPLVE